MSPSVHQSAGRPDGGQFTSTEHPEATGVTLKTAAVTPPPGYYDQEDELTAMPADQMGHEQVREWSEGEISYYISRPLGRLRMHAHRGLDTGKDFAKLDNAYQAAGASIADRLGRGVVRGPMVGPDTDDRLERLQLNPGPDMDADETKDWVVLEFSDRLTPLRDRIAQDAKAGHSTAEPTREFMATAKRFSSDVAAKFRPTVSAEDLA